VVTLAKSLFSGHYILTFRSFDIQYVSLYIVNLRTFVFVFYVVHVSLKRHGFHFRPLILTCVSTPYARH